VGGVGFFNLKQKRELEATVEQYNSALVSLNAAIHGGRAAEIDVSPEEATAEELALIAEQQHKIRTRLKKTTRLAENAKDLGITFHRTSGPLLRRRPKAKAWERHWDNELAHLKSLRRKVYAVDQLYGTGPKQD
jgi:hypothetical protein